MRRQDKYPDTKYFHFHNANPHNRITTDCVIRAISTATGIDYNTVVMELAEYQCKTGFDPSEKETYGKYLESKGWKKYKQPKRHDGTKYTGVAFCEIQQTWAGDYCNYNHWECGDAEIRCSDRIVAHIGGHHVVAIVDGKVYDHWNSTGGCIGNYWIKG